MMYSGNPPILSSADLRFLLDAPLLFQYQPLRCFFRIALRLQIGSLARINGGDAGFDVGADCAEEGVHGLTGTQIWVFESIIHL